MPKGEDPTGELLDAILILRGRCLLGSLDKTGIRISPRPNALCDRGQGEYVLMSRHMYGWLSTGASWGICFDRDMKESGISFGSTLYLMKIDSEADVASQRSTRPAQNWLILWESDEVNHVYKRVGIWRLLADEP